MKKENVRFLLDALKDAQCELDALKMLGRSLLSYEHTRVKLRKAIAIAEAEVNKEHGR